jgi:hypothetical protein
VAANCRYIVVFHFDGNFGLNYKDTPDRRKRTVNTPAWWKQRTRIMQDYVIPSLYNQTFQSFETWALVMKGYEEQSKAIVSDLLQRGGHVSFDGPGPIREHYRHMKEDWLGVIHHDSDDLYSRDAFFLYQNVEPVEGRIAYFHQGYIYGVNNKQLFVLGKKGTLPLAFYMTLYPKWALQSEPHWYGYRRIAGVAVDHFQIHKTKQRVCLPNGNFCQLIHGTNTVSAWKNPNLKKRFARKVTDDAERRKIMARFGVTL